MASSLKRVQREAFHREASRKRHRVVACNWLGRVVGTVVPLVLKWLMLARILSLSTGLTLHCKSTRWMIDRRLLRYEAVEREQP